MQMEPVNTEHCCCCVLFAAPIVSIGGRTNYSPREMYQSAEMLDLLHQARGSSVGEWKTPHV